MNKNGSGPTDALCAPMHDLLPDLETLYIDIHAHPELSMRETRTAGYTVTTAV